MDRRLVFMVNANKLSIAEASHDFHLLPKLTALENTMVPTIYAGISKPDRLERATNVLEDVQKYGDELSVYTSIDGNPPKSPLKRGT